MAEFESNFDYLGSPGLPSAPGAGWGFRVTKVDASTLRIQPGQRLADDGATWVSIADAFYLDVTFADIDTGAEAASAWYSLWVYYVGSTLTAVLSLSATAPTGVTAAKYFVGWFYNDSGLALSDFGATVDGASLRVIFEAAEPVASIGGMLALSDVGGTAPTTGAWAGILAAGVGTGALGDGAWPPDTARIRSLLVRIRAYGDNTVQVSGFGAEASMQLTAEGASGDRPRAYGWVASAGLLYYWITTNRSADYITVCGYVIDRSGITEDGTGL